MFVQSGITNEWWCITEKQYTHYKMSWSPNINLVNNAINFNGLNIDRGATVAKYNKFTYVLYYKYGDQQGHDIPILLNLDTGKSRRIHDSDNKNHNGARTDIKTAQIFKDKIYGMNIPRI
jgi:hypothetical protein